MTARKKIIAKTIVWTAIVLVGLVAAIETLERFESQQPGRFDTVQLALAVAIIPAVGLPTLIGAFIDSIKED